MGCRTYGPEVHNMLLPPDHIVYPNGRPQDEQAQRVIAAVVKALRVVG